MSKQLRNLFYMTLFKCCGQNFDDDDEDDSNTTANTDSWQRNNHGTMFNQTLIHTDGSEDMRG